MLLPPPLKPTFYRRVFGWQIGRRVNIGFSYIDAHRVNIADGVRIKHLNYFAKLNELQVGSNSYIGNFNQVSGAAWAKDLTKFPSRLQVGERVYMMSHHFIDVAGTVVIGDQVTIGGRETHLWSHSLVTLDDGSITLRAMDINIGAGVYLGSRVTLLGCSIPAGVVVGTGSVVTKSFPPDPDGRRLLLAGNPASVRKVYPLKS